MPDHKPGRLSESVQGPATAYTRTVDALTQDIRRAVHTDGVSVPGLAVGLVMGGVVSAAQVDALVREVARRSGQSIEWVRNAFGIPHFPQEEVRPGA